MDSMLYERTALSKKPEALIEQELVALQEGDRLTPDMVLRDPYMLDFLGLDAGHNERDLEDAIIRDLERFLLEMGVGFTFVERQKRIMVGGEDFYLDLLFFHRKLRRLIAIELKMERFRPAHKGQLELYLRWLDKHEREPWEESPLELILCVEKNEEQIELLEMEASGIHVAEYMTELPPRNLLEQRLRDAVTRARERNASRLLEAREE